MYAAFSRCIISKQVKAPSLKPHSGELLAFLCYRLGSGDANHRSTSEATWEATLKPHILRISFTSDTD